VVASWAVFRLKHGGRQCWGGPKIGYSPRTQDSQTRVTRVAKRRQGISKSLYSPQSCESLYTCPHTPFYRETKGLFTSQKYPHV
jgi:hypothetical protein